MPSSRIVEDQPERVPTTAEQAADTMAHIHPIGSARALNWPVVHRKDDALALMQLYDLGSGLHARPLLGENERAAGEILHRIRQQERNLQREYERAINVLMEAVVIAFAILEQKRRRLGLSRAMTSPEKFCMAVRKIGLDAKRLAPSIGDPGQWRVERRAQCGNRFRQWVGEISIFAPPEAMLRHDDPAAE